MCAQRADSYNGRTYIGTGGQDNSLKRSLRAKKIKIRENYIQNIYIIFTKYIQNIEKIYIQLIVVLVSTCEKDRSGEARAMDM